MKVYWDDYEEQETFTFKDLNEMEYQVVVSDPGIEVLEETRRVEMTKDQQGLDVEQPQYDLVVARYEEMGKLCIESVPPEEFFVDRDAKNIDEAYAVVHRTEMRLGDLIGMGYDYEEIEDLTGLQNSDSFSEIFSLHASTNLLAPLIIHGVVVQTCTKYFPTGDKLNIL